MEEEQFIFITINVSALNNNKNGRWNPENLIANTFAKIAAGT